MIRSFNYWINTHRKLICSIFGHLGKFEDIHVLCECGCHGTVDEHQICVFCETSLPLPESARVKPTRAMLKHYRLVKARHER